jgi:GMP synthase (glutamine-hydrolysing)
VKPVLLVRNDPFETFGVAPRAFAKADMPVTVWEAVDASPAPDLEEVGGLVVFGSSYNVEHADEHPFIHAVADLTRAAVERRVPYLGVCFGAQLLAWALGAEVEKAPVREVGFEPLRPLDAA